MARILAIAPSVAVKIEVRDDAGYDSCDAILHLSLDMRTEQCVAGVRMFAHGRRICSGWHNGAWWVDMRHPDYCLLAMASMDGDLYHFELRRWDPRAYSNAR